MALTLLDVVNWVRGKTGHLGVSSFSQSNESLDNVRDVNDAYEELIQELPTDTPYLMGSGELSLVALTRTYPLESDALLHNLIDWSVENETENDSPVNVATFEFIKRTYPKYDETTGKPKYIYREPNQTDTVGVYPVPDSPYTLKYLYQKDFTLLSEPTDTFAVPDRWLRYVKLRAKHMYEKRRNYGNPEETYEEVLDALAFIQVQCLENNPQYVFPERLLS